MTCTELLLSLQKHGAYMAPGCDIKKSLLLNQILQNMRTAILPEFMIELYKQCGGINLGNAYIFGPDPVERGKNYPIPSITDINRNIAKFQNILKQKTVFGRNDLFWFAFDPFGICYMLDNITLNPLRKYDDPYRAIYDCLIAGKI